MDKFNVIVKERSKTSVANLNPGDFFMHRGFVHVRHYCIPSHKTTLCTVFSKGVHPSTVDLPYETEVNKVNVSLTLEVTDTCAD